MHKAMAMLFSWILNIFHFKGRTSLMLTFICIFVLQLLELSNVSANERRGHCLITPRSTMSIGAVLDLDSLMGKQQKIAMEIAVQEFNRLSCSKLDLKIKDSHGNSTQAIAGATDLVRKNQVIAIVGTITHKEAILASEINNNIKSIPVLSLTSPAARTELLSPRLPYFIQMGDDISLHMQCIAAIVGEFRWKKVTAIYELNSGFSSDPGILFGLSYALQLVGSEIDNHLALPSLASLSDPKATIEFELNKLKRKSNRVFLIVQSSLELANALLEKAKQMGLMGKGSVWVIQDGVAGLLDSVNSSVISNIQGVIGFKSHIMEMSKTFRQFKFKFQKGFALEYTEEDMNNPSIFALQSYDATWAIAQAAKKSQRRFSFNQEEFSEKVLSSNFEGLGGKTSFRKGKLQESPTFNIINVIGKSYIELAFWSPAFGFSKNLVRHQLMEMTANNVSTGVLGVVYWPGGLVSVPNGWTNNNEIRLLKIGVPAKGAFTQFVNVSFDHRSNDIFITGFSIDVFKAAVKRLSYHLSYEFVPFNGSYDELVEKVHNKELDAAVGDTEIIAYRYRLVEFTQPYVESGLDMVVTEDQSKETWMFFKVFKKEMWLMLIAMHIFMGFVIWFLEREVNTELREFGSMLWFLVTVIFYAHREPITSPLARVVLAPWLFAIFIIITSFGSSLTSMMTISQIEPSVLDIHTLQRTNASVGCNGNSFIVRYLTEVLKFKPENIRRINSISEYPAAFKNKDIEAAFFVAPHATVFLAKYSCKGFIKAGNTFKLGGFGFAFRKGSSLAGHISEALLSMVESGETEQLQKDMLSTASCSSSENKAKNGPLGFQPFLGLFYICGTVAALTLLYAVICLVFNNVDTLMTHVQGPLAQLGRIWGWVTTFLGRCYSKIQLRKRLSPVTETRNAEETVNNREQSPAVIELVDVVMATHAS